MSELTREALKNDEAVIKRFRRRPLARSPALIALTMALALAGDRLHWSGYVLGAAAFALFLIVLAGEVDEEAKKMMEGWHDKADD